MLLLALIPILLPVACRHVDGDVLARIGSEDIRIKPFQAYLSTVSGQAWEIVDSRVASRMLDQYLEEEAVFLSHRRDRKDNPEDPGKRWHLLREIVEKTCGSAPTPSEKDIEAALRNRDAEQEPESVLIRQLLLPDESSAVAARKRLDAGEDFEALSTELSIAPNASRGGTLGWVARGTQPEEIEEVIFSLEKGEVSRPVKGPGGYHLFQLLDYREAGTKSQESLRSEISESMKTEAERRHLRDCIDTMVKKTGVTVYPRHLWFEYSGKFKEDFDEN